LFEQVVKASGLSSMFAAGAIERALVRSGVSGGRTKLGRAELERAMPTIVSTIRSFLSPEDASAAERRLRELL